jgi:type III pantothenate kinase
MLLLIDAGNTLVKWALVSDAADRDVPWSDFGAVPHEDLQSLTENWRNSARGTTIERILISNVAGSQMRDRLEYLLQSINSASGSIEWFKSMPSLGGVRNCYVDFGQLGCDRFAAMIGAHALFPGQALIVATCGTATTIDAVAKDGTFVGGMILPGLRLMTSSLAGNTAQLPQVSASDTSFSPFADNTGSAIVTGCITAQAGAIERAVGEHERSSGKVQCVLSGGAASFIAPYLSVTHRIVDNLVLIGLHTIATG